MAAPTKRQKEMQENILRTLAIAGPIAHKHLSPEGVTAMQALERKGFVELRNPDNMWTATVDGVKGE